VALCLCGCISVPIVNIPAKTAYERQLLGELEPLSEEEILEASVRAATALGPALDTARDRALAARRRQLFNRDDVQALLRLGCAGEAFAVQLVARPCARGPDFAARVMAEENADRATLMDWAIVADPQVSEADRPEVARLYRELMRANAPPGSFQEDGAGVWTQPTR
jgi:hypothetical protein